MGSSAASFALALLIYEATQQACALALILAANYGANIYLAPFVGSIADYFRRRSVILICDALLAAVAMVLSVVVAAGVVNQLGVVVLLVGAAGVLSACLSVSLTASMRQIRTETNLTRVNGFASLMENAPVFAGPVIGATLYSVAHPATIFVFDGLTFLAAAGLVMLVRWNDRVERRHRRLRPFAGAGEGLRWILSRSDFRYLQLSFAGINFVGGTGAAVLPAYVIASSTPAASQ